MPEDLSAKADALTGAVTALSRNVTALTTSQRRIKHVIAWTVLGLVLDLTLTIVVGLLLGNQHSVNEQLARTSDELAHNNARLQDVQARTSDQVLCPLYALFLAFEPRAKDSPSFTPEERAERAHAYDVIHQGYATLGCH